MLLFIEGPDKAGKTTFIRGLQEEYGFASFYMPYPESLGDEIAPIEIGDYFLGANTFLLEMYRALHNRKIDLAVHRGYISEYVYGAFFERKQYRSKLEWWIRQWPEDTAVIFLSIDHDQYLRRSGGGLPDTIPFDDEAKWNTMMERYQRALAIVTGMGKKTVLVRGDIPFASQFNQVQFSLLFR
jgi:thymidylate kinase